MNDLYIKRNKLCNISKELRTLKFIKNINRNSVDKIINEQNKVYNQYQFYNNYIKCINKMGGRLALRKEGEKL